MRNILLGIDLHGDSRHLVNVAIQIARSYDAKIWLLHVTLASAQESVYIPEDKGAKSTTDQMNELIEMVNAANLEAEGVLSDGGIAAAVLEQSQKLNINMIIVGHHKYGFFQKALFGHSSEEIIEKSDIPILVVPLGKR